MKHPKYAEVLIVAIINEGSFNWYILDSDICSLDLNILEDAYRKKGYNFVIDESYRFGIRVVDETTKNEFLENIKPFLISTSGLKKMMSEEKEPEEIYYSYRPTILIDFDKKCLLSYYPEYMSYEDYVPDSWTGKYQFFEDIIPEKFRFWE
ncbi:MAG: hypothetical protein K2I06_10425 [Ruminococcus sp.]|nr:hypothetical protein [Ruminococcus sp.]